MELAKDNVNNLKSSVYKVGRLMHLIEKKNTLDNWIMDTDSNYSVEDLAI